VAVAVAAMIMVMLVLVEVVLEVVRQVQQEWLRLEQQILAVVEAAAVAVIKQVKLVVLAL
jgi:hypothetical protein